MNQRPLRVGRPPNPLDDNRFHCVTCSDEALPAKILQLETEAGIALVEFGNETREVDISLVEEVLVPGVYVLVHGGVALDLATEQP